ncbi:MAG: hypothetical protein PGN07_04625 [Aeromicrobium erythreum]
MTAAVSAMADTPDLSWLATLPGRCPDCYFHVPTQQHRPNCPAVANVRSMARKSTEANTSDAEWRVFEAAVRADAAAHDGLVSQNRVREAIGARWASVQAKRRYSACWSRARRVGLLEDTDLTERSTDHAGGNAHRIVPVLRMPSWKAAA